MCIGKYVSLPFVYVDCVHRQKCQHWFTFTLLRTWIVMWIMYNCIECDNKESLNQKKKKKIWRAIFGVTLYLIWLNIPKYLRRDIHRILTCSDMFNVSSNVILRYWNELTILIFMNTLVISEKLLGIGLLVVWKSMKFVFIAFIVNLLLIHHLFNSLNLFMISWVLMSWWRKEPGHHQPW